MDARRALDALAPARGDQYSKIWSDPGTGRGAHYKDAPDDDMITGSTPDELNRAIRADWQHRAGHP